MRPSLRAACNRRGSRHQPLQELPRLIGSGLLALGSVHAHSRTRTTAPSNCADLLITRPSPQPPLPRRLRIEVHPDATPCGLLRRPAVAPQWHRAAQAQANGDSELRDASSRHGQGCRVRAERLSCRESAKRVQGGEPILKALIPLGRRRPFRSYFF